MTTLIDRVLSIYDNVFGVKAGIKRVYQLLFKSGAINFLLALLMLLFAVLSITFAFREKMVISFVMLSIYFLTVIILTFHNDYLFKKQNSDIHTYMQDKIEDFIRIVKDKEKINLNNADQRQCIEEIIQSAIEEESTKPTLNTKVLQPVKSWVFAIFPFFMGYFFNDTITDEALFLLLQISIMITGMIIAVQGFLYSLTGFTRISRLYSLQHLLLEIRIRNIK
ncbi:hypothetical protein [Bacillus alveayuensis]|uniref:hypothetical protein n=1 Tax=Aeribacillus alveayuensis TaxID=279215 RepID=UPI0005D10EB1|nr:hypothetical protein [Bacillus alveayuensis]